MPELQAAVGAAVVAVGAGVGHRRGRARALRLGEGRVAAGAGAERRRQHAAVGRGVLLGVAEGAAEHAAFGDLPVEAAADRSAAAELGRGVAHGAGEERNRRIQIPCTRVEIALVVPGEIGRGGSDPERARERRHVGQVEAGLERAHLALGAGARADAVAGVLAVQRGEGAVAELRRALLEGGLRHDVDGAAEHVRRLVGRGRLEDLHAGDVLFIVRRSRLAARLSAE